jgi:hypothetical protein
VRLDAAALFRRFGSDQALVSFDVVQGFGDGTAVQVKLFCSTVDVPAVRAHVRNELGRRLSPTLEHQLPPPRVRDANEKIIRRFRPQRAREVGKSIGSSWIVRPMQGDDLTGADCVDDALPKAKQFSPGLAFIISSEYLTDEIDGLLVTRAELYLPAAADRFPHASKSTPSVAKKQGSPPSNMVPGKKCRLSRETRRPLLRRARCTRAAAHR